jgi:aryl sulfotransferase
MTGLSLLCSYPKSGNTWLRAVLAEIAGGEGSLQLRDGLPFKVLPSRCHFDDLMGIDSSDLAVAEIDAARAAYCRAVADSQSLPRIWKIHDCFYPPQPDMAPPFPPDALAAVVYIVRDPRDVAVSFAHHLNKSVDETIARMADETMRMALGRAALREQLPQYLSTWSDHVESWLDAPGLNLYLMRYEDMLARPAEVFGKAVRFLGFDCDDVKLERALAACRFDVLQAREAQEGFRERPRDAEKFFRRGIAGGWRDSLTVEQEQCIVERHGRVMRRLGYLP